MGLYRNRALLSTTHSRPIIFNWPNFVCPKMLTLGIVSKLPLPSLTRIGLNSQFSILNSQFFSATRSLALRERGLRSTSSAVGTIALRETAVIGEDTLP